MGFLISLLIIILFLKVFVGISVGIFKFLLGLLLVVFIITIAPIGIVAIGLLLPLIVLGTLLTLVGFILKVLF